MVADLHLLDGARDIISLQGEKLLKPVELLLLNQGEALLEEG